MLTMPALSNDDLDAYTRARNTQNIGGWLLMAGILGALCAGIYSVQSATTWAAYAGAVGNAWIASLAALIGGLLIGFLFGIPRTKNSSSEAATEDTSGGYHVNTNLEQISDWLTKIIVGVGLTQIPDILAAFTTASELVAGGFGDAPARVPFASALLIYFLIVGFFGGYLLTRLYLQEALSIADRTLSPRVGRAVRTLNMSDVDVLGRPGDRRLTAAEASAVESLRGVPLGSLTTVEQITAWARAQLAAGFPEEAVRALARAAKMAPNNVTVLQEYATALAIAGRPEDATPILEEVRKSRAGRREAPLRRRNYEASMFGALYKPAPGGFEEAIRLGEEYLAEPQAERSAAIHVYLAAAYGQKHAWLQKRNNPGGEIAAVRAKVLEHVEKALTIDSEWLSLIEEMMNNRRGDNDLMTLGDDEELRALIVRFEDDPTHQAQV